MSDTTIGEDIVEAMRLRTAWAAANDKADEGTDLASFHAGNAARNASIALTRRLEADPRYVERLECIARLARRINDEGYEFTLVGHYKASYVTELYDILALRCALEDAGL